MAPNAGQDLKDHEPVVLVLDHDDDLQQHQEEEFDLTKLVGNFVPATTNDEQVKEPEQQPELQEPASQDGFYGAEAQAQFESTQETEQDFVQPELSPLVVPEGFVHDEKPKPMAAVEVVQEAEIQPVAVVADLAAEPAKIEEPVKVEEPVQVVEVAQEDARKSSSPSRLP